MMSHIEIFEGDRRHRKHGVIHSETFLLQLIVSALKCAAFHLMWAKVNAVNSTPAEVLIFWFSILLTLFFFSFHLVSSFYLFPPLTT